MRVLHAYNQHRGGGGSNNATEATIGVCRAKGLEIRVFTRRAADLPRNLQGRLRAGLSAFSGRDTLREFESELESFRPDLVHVHEIFPLISPWILPACTRRGIPVVMTCVDYRLTCPVVTHLRDGRICTRCCGGRPYWAAIGNCRGSWSESVTMAAYGAMVQTLRLYRNHIAHFVAPSEFTRAWLLEHLRMSPDRMTVIAPVVEYPPAAADPARGEYVAFAGRFAAEKGIGTLLEAARATGLPVRLARNVQSLVTFAVPPDVPVVVTRGREDLAEFYRRARLVVVPSEWFETFGLVGAEAMSHGIPVVAARIGAVAELVEDGVDGLQFEAGSVPDLARQMVRLWVDAGLARRFGAAARAKARRLWSADRHFERLCDVYGRQVARERDRAPRPAVESAAVP